MFQGSQHVAKAEHIALVQAAGGTMNGSTWLDRTNYFETLPAHQLELAPLARGGPDGDAARRAQPGEPRQPARGRQEREALVVRQPAVRLVAGEAPGPPVPARAPVPPLDDRLDGRTSTPPRSRTSARSSGPTTRRTTRSSRSSATSRPRGRAAAAERYFGGDPGRTRRSRRSATCRCRRRSAAERRETVRDRVPLPRVYVGFRAPVFGDPRLDALDLAGQILAGGKGSRLDRRLVRDERIAQDVALFTLGFIGGGSIMRRLGDRPARASTSTRVEAAFHEELERLTTRARHRRRARPRPGAHRGRRARRPPARRGAGRPAVDVRDAVRRSRTSSTGCCRATSR